MLSSLSGVPTGTLRSPERPARGVPTGSPQASGPFRQATGRPAFSCRLRERSPLPTGGCSHQSRGSDVQTQGRHETTRACPRVPCRRGAPKAAASGHGSRPSAPCPRRAAHAAGRADRGFGPNGCAVALRCAEPSVRTSAVDAYSTSRTNATAPPRFGGAAPATSRRRRRARSSVGGPARDGQRPDESTRRACAPERWACPPSRPPPARPANTMRGPRNAQRLRGPFVFFAAARPAARRPSRRNARGPPWR